MTTPITSERLADLLELVAARFSKWARESYREERERRFYEVDGESISALGKAERRLRIIEGLLKIAAKKHVSIYRQVAEEAGKDGCSGLVTEAGLEMLDQRIMRFVDGESAALLQRNERSFFAIGDVPTFAASSMNQRVGSLRNTVKRNPVSFRQRLHRLPKLFRYLSQHHRRRNRLVQLLPHEKYQPGPRRQFADVPIQIQSVETLYFQGYVSVEEFRDGCHPGFYETREMTARRF